MIKKLKLLNKGILVIILLSLVNFSSAEAKSCRNSAVKREFDKKMGFPKGRKGFVVDHICALACGGKDIVENMQYQTIIEGKKKDRWETSLAGCKKTCNNDNSTPTREIFNCN